MQNKMEIANSIFQSIDVIVDKKLAKLPFNSTIVGEIVHKEADGYTYSIKYQDKIFMARPIDMSIDYLVATYVYILVPNDAENRMRYIIGEVDIRNSYTKTLESRIMTLEQRLAALEKQIT